MNKKAYLNCAIGAFSLLLIDLVLAIPAEANVFTCRASALRVNLPPLLGILPLGKTIEPVVANPSRSPCTTDAKSLASTTLTLPLSILPPLPLPISLGNVVSATALSATTDASASNSVTAKAKVASASILGLLTAGVLDATAKVESVRGVCTLSGNSSVLLTSTLVPGLPTNKVITGPVKLSLLGGSIVLHLNEQIIEPGTQSGKITQRALRLELNILGGLLGGLLTTDVVVGEAIADFEAGCPRR